MAVQNASPQWKSFLVRIIFPTAITIALFLTLHFFHRYSHH